MRAYQHVNQARDACISTSIIAARQTLHSSTRRVLFSVIGYRLRALAVATAARLSPIETQTFGSLCD